MKGKFFVVLAVVLAAVFATGATAFPIQGTVERHKRHLVEGIAYTTKIIFTRHHHSSTRSGNAEPQNGTHVSKVRVDVGGVVSMDNLLHSKYDAFLWCPASVIQGAHSWQVLKVASDVKTDFTVSMNMAPVTGVRNEIHRCWLRVKVYADIDNEGHDALYRDARVPVDVEGHHIYP